MDAGLIRICNLLNEINATITNGVTLVGTLQNCVQILMSEFNIECAVYWQATQEDVLCPLFWYCPTDLMQRAHLSGEGPVGECFQTQKPLRLLDYDGSFSKQLSVDFAGITITSMLCVPVSSYFTNFGVLQLINKSDGTPIGEDEADVIEMMSMLCAIERGKNQTIPHSWSCDAPLLEARDITRDYTNGETLTKVLQGVDLNIYKNELVVLLGESGCGKSTLLNILAGLDEPTTGTVTFAGQDQAHASEHDLIRFRRNNIGIIFQSYNLIPVLNTRQNLSIIGELVQDPMDQDEILELVGLSSHEKRLPKELSGGQQQRVSIARALVKRPRIILADEPTAALDYDTSIEILQVLKSVLNTGCTIVMVTHNEELCRMANRVVRMRAGRVYQVTVNLDPVDPTKLVW